VEHPYLTRVEKHLLTMTTDAMSKPLPLPPMPEELILEMKGISKSFPGVRVFEDFDFSLRKGEIHCICGENGAGKSTLIKMLSGAYTPDKGAIYFDGKKVTLTPHSAMQIGIQTIYQEHTLFPLLSVVENVFVGKEVTRGVVLNRPRMVAKTREVLQSLNSNISPDDIVGSLGSGGQKTVEIAKALIQESKVIILDEPTASFSQTEIEHLLDIVRTLAQNGISIIYISHHLEEVFKIADRVTVIRDGRQINTYAAKGLTEQMLIRDMVGRDVSLFYHREPVPVGEVMFEARDLSGNGVEQASLSVRSGEILGIAGMVGSGRTELAELLFGVKKAATGEFLIKGQKINLRTPLSAIKHRMCFITEDRQATGLFLKHALDKNIPIASYTRDRSPFATPAEDARVAQKYVDDLRIITPSVFQQVMFLSGGNQQKVVLAKWFATQADIFIFDEPTRGIDVGAKEEIYKVMIDLLKQGKAIIMISSDMPELISMSDRIIVMRNGRSVAEVQKSDISEETILKYSIGGSVL
jgi:ribose transport system ATP-binding protein